MARGLAKTPLLLVELLMHALSSTYPLALWRTATGDAGVWSQATYPYAPTSLYGIHMPLLPYLVIQPIVLGMALLWAEARSVDVGNLDI